MAEGVTETKSMEESPEGLAAGKPNAKNVLRKVRDGLVSVILALTRVVFFWLPGGDVAHGQALTALHPMIIGSVIVAFFVVGTHHPARLIILAVALAVMTTQWLFGCVITRAEQQLTGNKETIVDPFLSLANIAVTRDTRNAATLAVGTAVAVIMVIVVACDTFLH
jgi:hypothetical protein